MVSGVGRRLVGKLLRALVAQLVLACWLRAAAEDVFSVVIPAGRLQCFFEPVKSKNFTRMLVDFQVLYGGDMDIDLIVVDPTGRPVLDEKRSRDGSHEIENLTLGDYQVCFDNTFSFQTAKTVFLRIELLRQDGTSSSDDDEEEAIANSPYHEALGHLTFQSEAFKERLNSIRMKLHMAERFQTSNRAHETRDRMLMMQKLERVNFWSVLNLSTLVAVGAIQVYIIRSFFHENSKGIRNMRQRT